MTSHGKILMLSSPNLAEYQSSSADKPCSNGACCGGAFTPLFCGYGDTYCGSTCVSQCSAVAECGKDAKVPGTECPLNVCCSQYAPLSIKPQMLC